MLATNGRIFGIFQRQGSSLGFELANQHKPIVEQLPGLRFQEIFLLGAGISPDKVPNIRDKQKQRDISHDSVPIAAPGSGPGKRWPIHPAPVPE